MAGRLRRQPDDRHIILPDTFLYNRLLFCEARKDHICLASSGFSSLRQSPVASRTSSFAASDRETVRHLVTKHCFYQSELGKESMNNLTGRFSPLVEVMHKVLLFCHRAERRGAGNFSTTCFVRICRFPFSGTCHVGRQRMIWDWAFKPIARDVDNIIASQLISSWV